MSNQKVAKKFIREALVATSFMAVFVIAGCNQKKPDFPDVKAKVNSSLTQKDLGSIEVSQDRDKGVMTLSGTVPTVAKKQQAESIAKQAASDYTIADEVAVVAPGTAKEVKEANADTDGAIQDNFKAALAKNKNLESQSVTVKSTNGVVMLSGNVETEADKLEAEKLANTVPDVKQVVDEIQVKAAATTNAKN